MLLDLNSRSTNGALLGDRSSRPEVRNPLLTYPSVARAHEMPAAARDWLIEFLGDFRRDAQERAAKSLRTHKAPLYFYHKVVGVFAGHLAKALRKARDRAQALEHKYG